MDDKEIECESVVKDMVQWWAVVSTIINNAIHKNEKFLLASQEPSSMEPDIFYRQTKEIKKEGEHRHIVMCLLLATATVWIRSNWKWMSDAKMPDMSTGPQPNSWTWQNVLAK